MAEFDTPNPNEYNDDAFCQADLNLIDAVQQMWDAGCNVEEIQEQVNNSIANIE